MLATISDDTSVKKLVMPRHQTVRLTRAELTEETVRLSAVVGPEFGVAVRKKIPAQSTAYIQMWSRTGGIAVEINSKDAASSLCGSFPPDRPTVSREVTAQAD